MVLVLLDLRLDMISATSSALAKPVSALKAFRSRLACSSGLTYAFAGRSSRKDEGDLIGDAMTQELRRLAGM